MNTNRRKTPFRYKLVEPFNCVFTITSINKKKININKDAEITLEDVSKFGCRITSDLNLNTQSNLVEVLISIDIINEPEPVSISGTVRWQSSELDLNYYGIKFEEPENEKDHIMSVLKTLAATNQIKMI
ncbi:PilZ domain-containing protein [Paenibacillus psychroresistens]|uniref:PilZ domain-containing protein n=1 Tax=Paenibacillus psychroresistens TaxID=1778678 RepID=A0A6B8RIP8_9BACL|nr:PilZ domain-containing protein [Paenibacillus psychroresistens]QGQ95614.1 PilZ domain-containing protein [Paenibacillus psychroresistens]